MSIHEHAAHDLQSGQSRGVRGRERGEEEEEEEEEKEKGKEDGQESSGARGEGGSVDEINAFTGGWSATLFRNHPFGVLCTELTFPGLATL